MQIFHSSLVSCSPVVALLLVGTGLLGCGSDLPAGAVTISDSNGVTIVTNVPAPTERPFATVDPQPKIEVGVAEGDPAYELFSVSDAGLLSDGSLVLLNSGTREFRVYDPQGVHLRTFGGSGEGPGEFRYIMEFWVLPHDTLLTVDLWGWRVSWLDSQGNVLRDLTVDRSGYTAETVHVLRDGSLMAYVFGPLEPVEGLSRQPISFVLIDPATQRADTLGWFGSLENYAISVGGRRRPNSRPFGRDTHWALAKDGVFVGDNASYEIGRYGLDGRLNLLIRMDVAPKTVSVEEQQAYRDRVREWVERRPESFRAFVERFLSEVPWPAHHPAFGHLMVDVDQHLWVGMYTPFTRTSSEYDVFDPQGVWSGKVALPDGVEPLEVGSDYLIGKRRDENDVEYVGVYPLVRSR